MQPVVAAGLLAAACHGAVAPSVPDAPILLTTVTWNVDGGRGDLGRLASDLASGRLAGRHSAAWLLLLQEVTEDEVQGAIQPGWSAFVAPVRRIAGNARGNAIVSTRPLRDARVMPLPRERQPRVVALASLEVAGTSLFVASVHLENRASWWRGGLPGDTARHRQVEALLDVLPADAPGILGGDLNTWLGPGEPGWRALAERFTDTADWPRSPTFADRLVLDHLLIDLPEGWRTVRWVAADSYGSDHHPVIAVLF